MSTQTIRLVVGLGNPGLDYARTRHNAGFWFLDALSERIGARLGHDAKLQGESGKADLKGASLWLLKPSTFMNASGRSVVAALRYFKIEPEQCLVAHDDLDLPAGTARLKFDGGHGGQNGLRDLIQHLGHGRFHRLRLGIGHPGHKDKVTSWVLGRPGKDDEAALLRAVDDALAVMPDIVQGQFEAAMRQLHVKRT